jgi:hypothetical protein
MWIYFIYIFIALIYIYYNTNTNTNTNTFGINVIFWNILCEGMGYGEFMTNGGDTKNIDWEKRKYKIADNIGSQLQRGRIVSCVEVDNYSWIVQYLKRKYPELQINSVYCPKVNVKKNYSNNNLSIYITTLLNKYDSSIEIVPNLKENNITLAYAQLIKFYLGNNINLETFESNNVSKEYMEFLSNILNVKLTPSMPYISFDCSVIFWSDRYFTKIKMIKQNIDSTIDIKNLGYIKYFNEDGFMGLRMRDNKTKIKFDIFVAHIKSGENAIAELERTISLTKILKYINNVGLKNRIICMDSNTSQLYQKNIPLGKIYDKKYNYIGTLKNYVTDIWKDYRYNNVIYQNKDTMCWKMRAGSRQKHKNGELMADTIDVILVPKNIYSVPFIPITSKITNEDYNYIIKWRTNSLRRAAIKHQYLTKSWENDINKNEITAELSKFLINTYDNDNTNANDNANTNKVRTIFKKMYPNIHMPSDHPMIGAIVYFNKY